MADVIAPQAKAMYATLAEWNTLEVSVRVDRAIVTRLLSRSGRILAGISSNMGITLLVEREKGVLRGRARTEEEAKEANRVLKLKVRFGRWTVNLSYHTSKLRSIISI